MPSFLHFYSQKHHDKEEQQGQQQQQQQKDDGEKEEAREARDDGPNDTGVGDVHRGTKEEKKRASKMLQGESRQKTKLENREMKRDEDEVVLVVFVSSGFFLSFSHSVSDSVAARIFFLRLIRFRARFSRS